MAHHNNNKINPGAPLPESNLMSTEEKYIPLEIIG